MFMRGAVFLVIGYVIFNYFHHRGDVTEKTLREHRVRQMSYWKDWRELKLSERIRMAPSSVVDYLTKDNILNGWPDRPRGAAIEPGIMLDLVAAIDEIPDDLRRKVSKKITGILVVKHLGGSAYTDTVYNTDGKPEAGFVVLDLSVLNRRANDWATWKESSPFKKSKNHQVTVKIAEASGDNRKSALQYILLHEFAHVLSISNNFEGAWGFVDTPKGNPLVDEFMQLSWNPSKEKATRKKQHADDQLGKIRFYALEDNRLPSTLIEKTYSFWATSQFPTLYAATNPGDDFAESLTNYVHTVLLKKPYEVKLFEEGAEIKSYPHCWNESRCQKKRQLIEKFLAQDK